MENQSENNDIDEVIIPTAPLYKQILNLYAEENAIEDTIFYLGEALRRGVIDLDVFLKVGFLPPHGALLQVHGGAAWDKHPPRLSSSASPVTPPKCEIITHLCFFFFNPVMS